MKNFKLKFFATIGGIAILATIHANGVLLGMGGEVASVAAERIEQRLRNAGIRLTAQDVKAIQSIEKHRERFMDMYRQLDAYQDAFDGKGNDQRTSQIAKQKEQMKLIGRQLPAADATVGGYYLELKRYLNAFSKKHNDYMNEIDASMKTYAKEVKAKSAEDSIPEPKEPAKTRFDDYVAYVIATSGDMEFYIQGQKINKGQSIPLKGNQLVTLRALALDSRRKQFRSFEPPSSATELHERTDYRLKYQVTSGNFKGNTAWYPTSEKYTWKFSRLPNSNAAYKELTSSFNMATEDDIMAFNYNGNFTVTINVSAKIKWQGDSERPGGNRTMNSDGQATGTITMNVGPAE